MPALGMQRYESPWSSLASLAEMVSPRFGKKLSQKLSHG